jgi:hypothetical protein
MQRFQAQFLVSRNVRLSFSVGGLIEQISKGWSEPMSIVRHLPSILLYSVYCLPQSSGREGADGRGDGEGKAGK